MAPPPALVTWRATRAHHFEPPERKKIHREPAALDGLHGHIDAMLKANPEITTAAIWQHLADEHGVTVAYPTLRTHVTGRRTRKPALVAAELGPRAAVRGVVCPGAY